MDTRKEHGLILAVAIGVGIFSGLLAFSMYDDYRTKKNVEAAFQGFSEALQSAGDKLEDELRESPEAQRQRQAQRDRQAQLQDSLRRSQRLRSATGQELYRECNEWREAYRQHAGYTVSEEMRESCGQLEVFLNTGRVSSQESKRKAVIYREG